MLLTAPPVPTAPANLPQRSAAPTRTQTIMIDNPLAAPIQIPLDVSMHPDTGPPPTTVDTGLGKTGKSTNSGIFGSLGAFPVPVVKPALPKAPLHISSGVAAGQLLAPIQPVYPAIAKAARIEGTVVVQAVISKEGRIENLHIVSGPPMLQESAVEAIQRARYRPFMLNGEPVAVETTIDIVFRMGG